MKMYSVKDGELECREVDADFFEKNTTLGGLLTPKEVDVTNGMVSLGINDVVVPDDANMIKVNAENSGNSAFYEMAEKFREGLKAGIDYGYEPSVSIVADNYTWGSIVPILDFKSMDPEQLTLDEPIPNHAKVCQELTETYEKKNADYGNSFENSLDKHGLIAGIIRMDDKMSRLISLNSKNERQVMDESMRDTLMDLANYAIMSVMWLDEQ